MASVVPLSCPSASLPKPSISSVSASPRYLQKRRFVAPSAISSISPPSSSSDSIVDALKVRVCYDSEILTVCSSLGYTFLFGSKRRSGTCETFVALKETVGHLRSAKWKDLWSLNSWVIRDYDRLVRTVNQLELPIKSLTDEQRHLLLFGKQAWNATL